MKKLILATGAIILSLGVFAPTESIAQASVDPDKPKYYELVRKRGSGKYCCAETTNQLSTCTGIPC
jgi:hypothetical protein